MCSVQVLVVRGRCGGLEGAAASPYALCCADCAQLWSIVAYYTGVTGDRAGQIDCLQKQVRSRVQRLLRAVRPCAHSRYPVLVSIASSSAARCGVTARGSGTSGVWGGCATRRATSSRRTWRRYDAGCASSRGCPPTADAPAVLSCAPTPQNTKQSLSRARMHAKGVLTKATETFPEHEQVARLAKLMADVETARAGL